MSRLLATVAAVLLVAQVSAFASDWPFFRGPNWNGISAETGLNKNWAAKPPKELWRITLSDRGEGGKAGGYAGPSVAAGKLFIIDHKGNEDIVRAIDIKTGKDVWSYPYPDTTSFNFGFARATPSYENGKLYTYSRLGVLNCLDAEKGTKIWSRDLKKELQGQHGQWDYASSVFIDGEKLIVPVGGPGHSVVALEKATGKTIWQGGGDDAVGYATPVLASIEGKPQYVVFNAKAVTGVDPQNGTLLWRSGWETRYDVNAAMPLVIGNTVLVTSNYQAGCKLVKIAGGKPSDLWTNKNLQAHFNSPLLYDGFIYGIGDPGNLLCMDPATGNAVWRQAGFEKGGLIAADGTIIALNGAQGDLVMAELSNKAYKELGRIKPLGGQSWTAPILADGKLYIRNKEALVCLDAK